MKAIQLKAFGGPENLFIGDWEKPVPKPHEVLVKVRATALNRADTMQRKGQYPPPKGESEILGLEIAGDIVALGSEVNEWAIGDRVCGLLASGGYAEYATVPVGQLLPIPKDMDYESAAGIPEVFLTAFQALSWIGQLKAEENCLIHAGASGVGTAAIQLAKAMGATVFVTASKQKHTTCLQLGATKAIDYKTENFQEKILDYTEGKGVDVLIDFIGAPYFQQNLGSMNHDGRIILLAFMGGYKIPELNILPLLFKRIRIFGSTLRARSLTYKKELTEALQKFAWPYFENGDFRPVIDSIYDWTEVAEAHRYMEANKNIGKIILKVS
ncbi:MAG: NAD(P)H-quinone oxidoreductase [Bacteroidota bacterium]